MLIEKIEFTELEKKISKTRKQFRDILASEFAKAFVIAITRDKCPACQRQKPKFNLLAKDMTKKHGAKVVFKRVHVKWSSSFNEESLRAKDVFGHYFYPTNLILVKTEDKGAVELYKNVSPRISELKRNIEAAVKIAETLKKRS
jgi:hypothetical protein